MATSSPQKHRVLIVEEDPLSGEGLSRSFSQMGYSVCKVRSAGDAVAVCKFFPPDVAVVDLSEPLGTGYELARYIRETCAEAVLILTTASRGFILDRERADRSGVDRHFARSSDLGPLLTFVADRRS